MYVCIGKAKSTVKASSWSTVKPPSRRSDNCTLFSQNPPEVTFEEPVKRYSWRDTLTVSLVSLNVRCFGQSLVRFREASWRRCLTPGLGFSPLSCSVEALLTCPLIHHQTGCRGRDPPHICQKYAPNIRKPESIHQCCVKRSPANTWKALCRNALGSPPQSQSDA